MAPMKGSYEGPKREYCLLIVNRVFGPNLIKMLIESVKTVIETISSNNLLPQKMNS